MRTKSYGEKGILRKVPGGARVIPIRPPPMPDPKITFIRTNHVIVKDDDGESVLVFHGKEGHLLSLPTPGRGSVVVLSHFSDITVLGNGATLGKEKERLTVCAQTIVRFRWNEGDGCWYLEPILSGADRELFLLPLPLGRSDP
jgi:hypothetical protein